MCARSERCPRRSSGADRASSTAASPAVKAAAWAAPKRSGRRRSEDEPAAEVQRARRHHGQRDHRLDRRPLARRVRLEPGGGMAHARSAHWPRYGTPVCRSTVA